VFDRAHAAFDRVLIPRVDWACAITEVPTAAASATISATSSAWNCGWRGISREASAPPEGRIGVSEQPVKLRQGLDVLVASGCLL
jgi:hypothetical protein